MDQQDQIKAFALRCQGKTWAEIGEELHYDEQTVSKSLRSVINYKPRKFGRVVVHRASSGSGEKLSTSLKRPEKEERGEHP